MVTSGIISTGSIPVLDIDGPVYTDLRLPFYITGSTHTYTSISTKDTRGSLNLRLEGEIRPVLEQLSIQNRKSIKTRMYLVTLKRMGYDGENLKYKEWFEESLTKVNQKTKKILEGILQSTKTISRVVSSIGVLTIEENGLSDL
jgi:hypothetical protein